MDTETEPGTRALALARLIVARQQELVGRPVGNEPGRVQLEVGPLLGAADPDLQAAVRAELTQVLTDDELCSPVAAGELDAKVDDVARRLGNGAGHTRDALWALLGGDDRLLVHEPERTLAVSSRRWRVRKPWDDEGRPVWPVHRQVVDAPRDRRPTTGSAFRTRLAREMASLWMNGMIVATCVGTWLILWVATPDPPDVPVATLVLKAFALWCLTFLPCWLYVRFLGQRAGALWDEYVLHLHRFGWDEPAYLPRPPRTSQFYDEWARDGGRLQGQDRNIYRQKFNAYYGRSVSETAAGEDFRLRLDTLFPVFLTVAVLSVCWTTVLWDDRFLTAPQDVWDVLKWAFVGAYAFNVQMLTRRFFASDLRPSAYTSALVRIVVVLLGTAIVYQLTEIWLSDSPDAKRWQAVVAFAIGFFPLIAAQVVVHAASGIVRVAVPSLHPDYPLGRLDGLHIWYEARLAEENIDDMQNLTTANLVDVILHTRVPVGRLVDWVDQAFLHLALDRVENTRKELREASSTDDPAPEAPAFVHGSVGSGSRAGTVTLTALRQLGIRTATGLIRAFPPDQVDPLVSAGDGCDDWFQRLDVRGLDRDQVRTLVRVLDEESGLGPVWNWYDRGPRARNARRRPRTVQDAPDVPDESSSAERVVPLPRDG